MDVAAASYKTCVIVEEEHSKRSVYCWGTDEGGGTRGVPAVRKEPFRVAGIDDARELAVGWGLACVRRADATVWCWGNDAYGELGRGPPRFGKRAEPTSVPVRALHIDDAVSIGASGFRACVLTARGSVGCWGDNSYGALGDGTTSSRPFASDVVGLTDVHEIAVGGFAHACARRREGTVWCWGYAIGTGSSAARKRAEQVPGLGDAVAIAAGHTHVCALRRDRSVVCWGDNSERQLGDGTSSPATAPREVLGPE